MSTSVRAMTAPARVAGGRSIGRRAAYGAVVLAIVTSGAFGALSFFAPTTFLSIVGEPSAQLSVGAQVFAAYTGARELAIAATLLMLLVMRATRGLAAVMLLAALANGFDFVHALVTQRWLQAPGALVFAIISLAAAIWLFRRPARQPAA